MKFFIDLFVTLALALWPLVYMASFMSFTTESARAPVNVLTVMCIIGYPLFIVALYMITGSNWFGFSTKTFSLVIIVIVLVSYLPYLSLIRSTVRGVSLIGYDVKDSVVYYGGRKLDGVLEENFKLIRKGAGSNLDGSYATDGKKVFFEGKELLRADAGSFQPVNLDCEGACRNVFWKDKSAVYFHGDVLRDANSQYFTTFKGEAFHYGKDNESVYIWNRKIDADASSFLYLGGGVAKDNSKIFYEDKPILPQANVTNFEHVSGVNNETIFKDSEKVYYISGSEVKTINIDANSIKTYDGKYADFYIGDKNNVYYILGSDVSILTGANPDKFRILTYEEYNKLNADATDENTYYRRGKKVSISK